MIARLTRSRSEQPGDIPRVDAAPSAEAGSRRRCDGRDRRVGSRKIAFQPCCLRSARRTSGTDSSGGCGPARRERRLPDARAQCNPYWYDCGTSRRIEVPTQSHPSWICNRGLTMGYRLHSRTSFAHYCFPISTSKLGFRYVQQREDWPPPTPNEYRLTVEEWRQATGKGRS